MEITLPPDLEAIVNEKVESGNYNSASDVVHEAIRLMTNRDAGREQRNEDIRRKVAHALAQAERGELYSFDSGADAMDYITSEGRKMLTERAKQPAGKA